MPLHVEQLRAAAGDLAGRIRTEVGDARDLDLDDDSADAVLLLGPLYHLVDREQRLRALREVRRVARPGAPVLVSAISRWAPRLHGYLAERLYERAAFFPELVRVVEESGRLNESVPGWFTAYCHRPEQLRDEVTEAASSSRTSSVWKAWRSRWATSRNGSPTPPVARSSSTVPGRSSTCRSCSG